MSRDLNVVTLLFFRYVPPTEEKDALLHVPSRGGDEEAASSESREREIRLILDSFSRSLRVAPPRFPVANFIQHGRTPLRTRAFTCRVWQRGGARV